MRSMKLLASMSIDHFVIFRDGQPPPGAVYKCRAQGLCLLHGRGQVSEVFYGSDRDFVGSLGYGSALVRFIGCVAALGFFKLGVAAHGFFRLGVDWGGFFLLGGIMRSVMASFEAGGLASPCLPFGAAGRVCASLASFWLFLVLRHM